ncbi:MAG: PAS domain S-box protein [Bacillota bacterium]
MSLLREVVEHSPQAFCVTDTVGRIIALNRAFCELTGYSREELEAEKSVAAALLPVCVYKEECPGEPCLTGNKNCETEWTRKDGSRVPVRLYRRKICDNRGNIRGYCLYINDITEFSRAEAIIRICEEQLRSLASRLLSAEERERRRIATDLHDQVGQVLAIGKIKLEELRATVPSGFTESIDGVRGYLEDAIRYTRSLTAELSPPILYLSGLEAALEWFASQIQEKHGIAVAFFDDGLPKPVGQEKRVFLFRAVRELLTNVVKHARARNAKVFIARDGPNIRVTVEDNGVGFDAARINCCPTGGDAGFGLFYLREQSGYFGGRLEVESGPGKGSRLTIVVPLEAAKEVP